jgi:hypothetical protein
MPLFNQMLIPERRGGEKRLNQVHQEENIQEAGNHSDGQETPCNLWQPKFHYSGHTLPILEHILSLIIQSHCFIRKSSFATSHCYTILHVNGQLSGVQTINNLTGSGNQ